MKLSFEPNNEATFGPCQCCDNMTRRFWGYVHDDGHALAVYYVEWTPGHEHRMANFDFIIGAWGEGTSAQNRVGVSLAYRNIPEQGPEFMVVEAKDRPLLTNTLAGRILGRTEILESSLHTQIFKICDAIYLQDPRIEAIRT